MKSTPQRAYLDTEFTQLDSRCYQLISMALVVPGGPEFYVELTDSYSLESCSEFVHEVVLPQLDFPRYGRRTSQAREELMRFLSSLGEVEIISDAPDWDWPLLRRLIPAHEWPENVRRFPGVVAPVSVGPDDPEPPHHALLDARMLAEQSERSLPASKIGHPDSARQ
jgi:hypothetical protein